MHPVYSTQFIVSHAGQGVIYQVPAGYKALVKSVTAFCSAPLPEEYNLVHQESNVTICWGQIVKLQTPDVDYFSHIREFRFIAGPGEHLYWFASGDIDGTVSGYLLTLP